MIIEYATNLFLHHELFNFPGQAGGTRNRNPEIVDDDAFYYFEIDARHCDGGDPHRISAETLR